MNEYKPEGALILTERNSELISSLEGLKTALAEQIIIEAPVILCDHAFNLHVDFPSGVHGIIPRGEVEDTKRGEAIKDIAILTRVGKTVAFKVTGIEKREHSTVARLSRRQAQRECRLNYISTLRPGDVIPAKITHLESFGAFVDIGVGITSLLSIDSMSVSRIAHPRERVSVGESIYSVVKAIDDDGRIYMSERELLGTWLENAERFTIGECVRGIVRSVESYGVFVELMPNLAGLAEYRDDVEPGQTVAVYIKSIIPGKMKIKLIIIDTSDMQSEKMPLEYFVDPVECQHIDDWKYSPEGCAKVIESVF